MLRLISFSIVVAALSMLSLELYAAERVELYSAKVEVSSQQSADRSVAFREALKHVLIKVTGDEANLTNDDVVGLLDRADRYVLTFSYQNNPRYQQALDLDGNSEDEGSASIEQGASVEPSQPQTIFPYVLSVAFEERALLNELRALELPIWGALRPSILTWAVLQNEGDRVLLSESSHESSDVLLSQAADNGLAMFLPAGDLEDQSNVSLNELWGLFPDAVSEASSRYPHDLVLLSRVYEAPEALELKWTLLLGREHVVGRAQDVSYQSLWRTMQLDIVKILAERYAVTYDPELDGDETVISVSRVRSFLDYAKLVDHLNLLSSVEAVGVRSVQQDKVELGLKLRSSVASFNQQVELAGLLEPVFVPEPFEDLAVSSLPSKVDSAVFPEGAEDNLDGFGDKSPTVQASTNGMRYFYLRHQGE